MITAFALLSVSSIFCQLNNTTFYLLNDVTVANDNITLDLNGPVKYNIFKISNPPRLVVDLTNTEQNVTAARKEQEINGKLIKRVRTRQFQNEPTKIARVVLDLEKIVSYKASMDNNQVMITLVNETSVPEGESVSAPAATVAPATPAEKPSTTTTAQSKKAAGEKSQQSIKKQAEPPAEKPVPAESSAESQQVASGPESATPPVSTEPAITQPAAADQPVVAETKPQEEKQAKKTAVPAKKESKKTKQAAVKKPAVSEPAAKNEAVPVQPVVQVPVKPIPVKKAAVTKKAEAPPSNLRTRLALPKTLVTLEYQDADIRDVLQIMSLRSGLNIICGADVSGTITLSLKDVPFDQAFNTMLSLKGLSSIPVGDNIVRVLTPNQLMTERQQALTFTKVFALNYADAADMMTNLTSIRNLEGRKGLISVDKRNNALIITDTQEGLMSCEQLIRELDIKPDQVCIEARMVDVNLNDLSELGVNWNFTGTKVDQPGTGVKRNNVGVTASGESLIVTGSEGSGVSLTNVGTSLAAPLSGGFFNFGYINNTSMLMATLGALVTQNKTKVLANPRITTLNNELATIMIVDKMPYKTTTMNQNVVTESWAFIDAGVKLSVTPTISPDGWITMRVKPEVSVPVSGAVGAVNTRQTDVIVMVQNNETIVIGGLIREDEIKSLQKVPFLGDLPLLGELFKYKQDTKKKTELLIFITPKILEN
jgi:type IV pilus assembly protein PilQ